LQQLDSAVRDRIEIWLAGRPHDPIYYQELLQTIGHTSGVKIIGECDHQQCLDLMAASDVIVCPSRDDPFPVVVVEALCLSKLCIVSSQTGFAELISDGTNGFVIPNEDSTALAAKLTDIVQRQDDLPRIRRAARQLYDRHLTLDSFEKKFLSLLRTQQPAVTRQTQIQKELLCQD
jgi:glycosyltransferase involved in cell wall biosynthesis